jgi:tubby-related protein 1
VDNPDDIICQFGKVGEDKFHLDFKAPISPFQAFGIALTQFNI